MKVFNKGVFWHPTLDNLVNSTLRQKMMLSPTMHYRDKCDKLNLSQDCYKCALYGEVVEIEVTDGVITKVITRLDNRYNKEVQLCFAVALNADNTATVKTVWTNNKNDNHSTIKTENYSTSL